MKCCFKCFNGICYLEESCIGLSRAMAIFQIPFPNSLGRHQASRIFLDPNSPTDYPAVLSKAADHLHQQICEPSSLRNI